MNKTSDQQRPFKLPRCSLRASPALPALIFTIHSDPPNCSHLQSPTDRGHFEGQGQTQSSLRTTRTATTDTAPIILGHSRLGCNRPKEVRVPPDRAPSVRLLFCHDLLHSPGFILWSLLQFVQSHRRQSCLWLDDQSGLNRASNRSQRALRGTGSFSSEQMRLSLIAVFGLLSDTWDRQGLSLSQAISQGGGGSGGAGPGGGERTAQHPGPWRHHDAATLPSSCLPPGSPPEQSV